MKAREVVDSMVAYSFLKRKGCDHVQDYPDFQTWTNLVAKALASERQKQKIRDAEIVRAEISCDCKGFCECYGRMNLLDLAQAIREQEDL